MAGVANFPFDPRRRLHSRKQFDRVFRKPVRSVDPLFTVLAKAGPVDHPRLGMAISVKAAGGAAGRNRVKRIVRESFRLNQDSLPAVDLVVMAKSGIDVHGNHEIRASLEDHWQRIRRKCENSSSR